MYSVADPVANPVMAPSSLDIDPLQRRNRSEILGNTLHWPPGPSRMSGSAIACTCLSFALTAGITNLIFENHEKPIIVLFCAADYGQKLIAHRCEPDLLIAKYYAIL